MCVDRRYLKALTDCTTFRASISLSSQLRLSRCTLFAICCSISNLEDVKIKTNPVRLVITNITVSDKRKYHRVLQHNSRTYLDPSMDPLPKLIQELTRVGPQLTDKKFSLESMLVRVLVLLLNRESLLW